MKKTMIALVAILLAGTTAALRTLQYISDYDPVTELFDLKSVHTVALNWTIALTAVFFILLAVVTSRSKKEPASNPTGRLQYFGSLMLLFLTGFNFILILYGFTSGNLPTVPEFINDICVAALVIYAVTMCLYTSNRKSKGLEMLSLIPVFTFVAYLIASFVSVTEMAVPQTYMLMIFSICSLILFFFYDAKGLNLNKRRNVAGVFGFLSFIFLCGQYIPMMIVPALSSVTANSFMLTDILMGIALIIFTFTYSLYLLDQ